MIPYIRVVMRNFNLLILFFVFAQTSWAFVVSDTLIIDGEVIYLEEQDIPLTDSISQSRMNDFKEKKRKLIWGIDGGFGMQMSSFVISNNSNSDLFSVTEFAGIKQNTYYHSSLAFGGYMRVHKNIEIGIGFQDSKGNVSEATAVVNNFSESNIFYASNNQIFQVYETEVQPDVVELDTARLAVFSNNFQIETIQIPIKFRFYVNDFSVKSKWRAFGEISPVYRSYKLNSSSALSNQLLFLNASGNYEYRAVLNQQWNRMGVMVGIGSEFMITKRLNAFVQANWNFPPVNVVSQTGLNYFSKSSNVFLGMRILIGKGK